jgi:hypothetical protein
MAGRLSTKHQISHMLFILRQCSEIPVLQKGMEIHTLLTYSNILSSTKLSITNLHYCEIFAVNIAPLAIY